MLVEIYLHTERPKSSEDTMWETFTKMSENLFSSLDYFSRYSFREAKLNDKKSFCYLEEI